MQSLIAAHVVAIMDYSSINSTWATSAANAHIPVLSLNESASGDTYEANPDFLAAMYGALLAGATVAAVNPQFGVRDMAARLGTVDPRVVIASTRARATIASLMPAE